MTIKVTMPQMGESVYEGTLTKWLKQVGDSVELDEPLFEISTDKVDSEIPSPASGVLSEILVPEGTTIKINTTLAVIKDSGNGKTQAPAPPKSQSTHQTEEEPKEPEEPESEQSTENAGINEVRVQSMPEAPELPSPDTKEAEKPAESIQVRSIRTSPLVRKIARENNIDLSDLKGTGLGGRITKEDILKYMESGSQAEKTGRDHTTAEQQEPSGPQPPSVHQESYTIADAVQRFTGETQTVPMNSMRKAIAEHMVYSKRTSPHVSTVFEVDMQSIARLREHHKKEFLAREGISLTYTPFFAKALIDTVREYPIMNASLSGDNIVYKKPINLGIAVALDDGLIVPVIKNAQLKNLTGIALKIDDLAGRARSKKLKPEEVQDGTISITNPGRHGALFATPIINQPQVAILGIGGIEKRPIVIDDAIAIRPMVCLSLTFDHRVIDGATADQFMAALKHKLQSWTQWSD